MSYGSILNQSSISNNGSLPIGIICMWSGATNNVPDGWHICDGTNGTPNLQDRFVVGAGSIYAVGATGGEATHKLTVAEMPSHNHSLSLSGLTCNSAGSHSHTFTYAYDGPSGGQSISGSSSYEMQTRTTSTSGGHTHTISGYGSIGSSGSGNAHNNLPPYYALCYIMKIA